MVSCLFAKMHKLVFVQSFISNVWLLKSKNKTKSLVANQNCNFRSW
jgi:hypothetical protein